MNLQELIARGRFIFSGANARLDVFKQLNGKNTAKEIARKTGRSQASVLNDIKVMKDMGLILEKKKDGKIVKKDGANVYKKDPVLLHVPVSYFKEEDKNISKNYPKKGKFSRKGQQKPRTIAVPGEKGILYISNEGEDQLYEFKQAGVDVSKMSKEVAAFANTKSGGLLFYGLEDDGTIAGVDKTRQVFDQEVQNSIKNTITPSLVVQIKKVKVLGQTVFVVSIPAWNKNVVYQYRGRVYLRKGTNVFIATPEELKDLHKGKPVV